MCRVCGDIPVVLCGINNMDMKNREVKAKQVTFQRERSLPYYEISAESNFNFEKPFLYLARKLVGDEKLHFEKSHALAESRLILLPTGEQLRSFHSMSPNTCIKICILSLCILSLLWIHLPILESDCGHLAAYT
jgi:hypothetical protein